MRCVARERRNRMLPVDYLPAARRDFDESFDWYAERSLSAALGFVDSVDAALSTISADTATRPAACVARRPSRQPAADGNVPSPVSIPARCSQTWAMLVKRVYEIDRLACPQCGGQMHAIIPQKSYSRTGSCRRWARPSSAACWASRRSASSSRPSSIACCKAQSDWWASPATQTAPLDTLAAVEGTAGN